MKLFGYDTNLSVGDWLKVGSVVVILLGWGWHAVIVAQDTAADFSWMKKQVHELRWRVWCLEHPDTDDAHDYIKAHPEIYKGVTN